MKAASFSSLSEASAAFALGPVRFRCMKCGRVHWSHREGWRGCMEGFFYGETREWSHSVALCSGGVHLRDSMMLTKSIPPLVLLGRERLLDDLGRLQWPSSFVGSFPEVLALSPESFEEAISAARRKWKDAAFSVVLEARRLVLEAFPDPPGPAFPFPALSRSGSGWCLFFRTWALCFVRDGLRVVLYPGVSLSFYNVSGLNANEVLDVMGSGRVRVADVRKPSLKPRGAVREVGAGECDFFHVR